MLYWLINILIISYTYATIAFLISTLFVVKARIKKTGFLNRSNSIVLGILSLNLIVAGFNALNSEQDIFITYYGINRFQLFALAALLVFLFQLCFIWKKYRVKLVSTIACIVQLLILTRMENIISLIVNQYPDYLPSSWSSNPNPTANLLTITISILYFIICWMAPSFTLQFNTLPKKA